jgi:MFS family permease
LKGLAFRIVCASYFLQGYVGYIFVFWSFLYLREVRHFSLPASAVFTALPMLATTFAIPLGGVLSDVTVQRLGPTWGRRLLPLVALTLAGVFLALSAFTPSAMLSVVCLSICTVLVLSTEGPYWATVNHLVHDRGGLAGGIMNFGSNLGGMISPVLTPWIAERLGWGPALGLAAALSVVAGLLWLGVHVRRPEVVLVEDRRRTSP